MASTDTVRSLLTEGDRRSIGRANEAVAYVRSHLEESSHLIECLWDSDDRVRMRASDAIEKLSREGAGMFQPYKTDLLALLTQTTQQEVKWHLAVTIPRLKLTAAECRHVAECLEGFLQDRSSLVKTFAMQGLADLVRQDPLLRPLVVDLLRYLQKTGTPAMRARGRMLLEALEVSVMS